MRAWLSNGIRYKNADGNNAFQSSMLSHQLLQAPFEILSIAITLFLTGIGVYLGSSLANKVELSTGGLIDGNRGGVIAFIISTYFILALFGQILGGKDVEVDRCHQHAEYFRTCGDQLGAGNEKPEENDSSQEQVASNAQPAVGDANNDMMGLADALQKAAEAHRVCAAHDTTVANQFEGLRHRD